MAECNNSKWRGIFLTDTYTYSSRMVLNSLKSVGYNCLPVVLEESCERDNGDWTIDMFSLVCNDIADKRLASGKPLYYNKIDVKAGYYLSNGKAERQSGGLVKKYGEIIAEIKYRKGSKLYRVDSVKWFNKKGKLVDCDYYNIDGYNCAKASFDDNGEMISKSWFSMDQMEKITYIVKTGTYMYRYAGKEYVMNSVDEVLRCYFDNISEKIDLFTDACDTLIRFGNCESFGRKYLILSKDNAEKETNNLDQYRGLDVGIVALDAIAERKVVEKGYTCLRMGTYIEGPKNTGRKEILICTWSDDIEKLGELVGELEDYRFHIAAVTYVSDKLMEFNKRENVKVYPGIKRDALRELFSRCDFLLDINHLHQLFDSVFDAFSLNQIIFAFNNTVHERMYIDEENIFSHEDWKKMAEKIRACDNEELRARIIQKQKERAFSFDDETCRTFYNALMEGQCLLDD